MFSWEKFNVTLSVLREHLNQGCSHLKCFIIEHQARSQHVIFNVGFQHFSYAQYGQAFRNKMWNGSGRDVYFGYLKFPADPAAAVGILKGKSNFARWHSAIEPILLSNPHSSRLIIESWAEPRLPPGPNDEQQAIFDEERREWHSANTATCRFIRATLAENVVPFVRQYNSAKLLFFNLVWLYGEDAGIDTQGGPPVPANAPTLNSKRGRTSLLAVLEAKRTVDYLPPVGMTFKFPSPSSSMTTSSKASSSSSDSRDRAIVVESQKKLRQTLAQESAQEQHTSLIRGFERTQISSDPNLETIHEHEEPHPGRRVPSGYAIDFKFDDKGNRPREGISPLTLSDGGSQYEEVSFYVAQPQLLQRDIRTSTDTSIPQDECNLDDLSNEQSTRPKKRQASSDQNSRPSKANIVSILKNAKPGKSKTRDKLPFSFPLRRMDADRDKDTGQIVTN